MRYVKSEDVRAGMRAAAPLYDSAGTLLLAANYEITENTRRRIGELGFHGVFVLDGDSDRALEPLLDDGVRLGAMRALGALDVDQVMYVANAVVSQVMASADRAFDMDAVCCYDSVTYMHSVNVAVLSAMIGVAMGMDNKGLVALAQAALFHDIGKTMVPAAIIRKPGKLEPDEFDMVKKHPGYAYGLLLAAGTVPEEVMEAVRCHHENQDGTGYPRNLSGDAIPLMARIIHVADVYDALVSRRPYKKPMNPADALEYLMANCGTMFDRDCVAAAAGCVALYPVGTGVRLSNGLAATVVANRRGWPSRPIVRTVCGTEIDLMRVLNVTVTGFVRSCGPAMASMAA